MAYCWAHQHNVHYQAEQNWLKLGKCALHKCYVQFDRRAEHVDVVIAAAQAYHHVLHNCETAHRIHVKVAHDYYHSGQLRGRMRPCTHQQQSYMDHRPRCQGRVHQPHLNMMVVSLIYNATPWLPSVCFTSCSDQGTLGVNFSLLCAACLLHSTCRKCAAAGVDAVQ